MTSMSPIRPISPKNSNNNDNIARQDTGIAMAVAITNTNSNNSEREREMEEEKEAQPNIKNNKDKNKNSGVSGGGMTREERIFREEAAKVSQQNNDNNRQQNDDFEFQHNVTKTHLTNENSLEIPKMEDKDQHAIQRKFMCYQFCRVVIGGLGVRVICVCVCVFVGFLGFFFGSVFFVLDFFFAKLRGNFFCKMEIKSESCLHQQRSTRAAPATGQRFRHCRF